MANLRDLNESDNSPADFTDGMDDVMADNDWNDPDDEPIMLFSPCHCLCCSEVYNSPIEVFDHCKECHNTDIYETVKVWRMDSLSYIKLINYIRHNADDITLNNTRLWDLTVHPPPWENDIYLRPFLPDDGLLQFDPDEITSLWNATVPDVDKLSPEAIQRLREAELRTYFVELEFRRVSEELQTMRNISQSLVADGDPPSGSTNENAIKNLRMDEDESYFDSYGHFGIHQEMLQDSVRTESYRSAILENAELFRDKVVLDVGCGTAVLAMFAARAGARRVIAVDMSDIVYDAMDIVRANNLDDKITLIKGRIEDVDIGVEKVDIIISEWMGYFLLFESMLDSVLFARDRYLRPFAEGGDRSPPLLLPSRCSLHLAASSDLDLFRRHVTFWDDVYGFSMSCLKEHAVREANVTTVDAKAICTEYCEFKTFDLMTCQTKDLDFIAPFALTAMRDADLTALVAHFDVLFSGLPREVSFSTGPLSKPTHWKQTVFLLPEIIPIKKGDIIHGELSCGKSLKDPRALRVKISMAGRKLKYLVA